MTNSVIHKTFAGLLIISFLLSLSACKVQFEPDIQPSGLGTVAPEQPFEEITETEGYFQLPLEGQTALVPGISSKMAIEICSTVLTWGDELMGMCEAPGGEHYLFWVDPREVFVVHINTLDKNQVNFREAVVAFESSAESIRSTLDDLRIELPLFLITFFGLPVACSTGFGCILDGAAALGTGLLTANSGDAIIDDVKSGTTAWKNARFNACLMHGGDDLACRKESGIE